MPKTNGDRDRDQFGGCDIQVLSLEEAIRSGHVIRVSSELRVDAKYARTDHDLVAHYDKLVARDHIGALAMCEGDDSRVWDIFTRMHDSIARIKYRQRMMRKAAKPTRALDSMARRAVKNGLAKTIEEAKKSLAAGFGIRLEAEPEAASAKKR